MIADPRQDFRQPEHTHPLHKTTTTHNISMAPRL
jgi:hypothetical protein